MGASQHLFIFFSLLVGVAVSDIKVPKSEKEQVEYAIRELDSDGHFTAFLSLLRSNSECLDKFTSLPALTVFVPTDEAFGEKSVQEYIGKLTKEQTIQFLSFHALPRYYSQSSLESVFDQKIVTVATGDDHESELFRLVVQSDYHINTTLGLSRILTEAFDAYPVVLYVVDKVLISPDIVFPVVKRNDVAVEALHTLSSSSKYKTFVKLLKKAEVWGDLQFVESFTLFVPTEKAFWSLPSRASSDDAILAKVLKYHVVPGFYPPWMMGFIKAPLPTLASEGKDYRLTLKYMGGLKVSIETGVTKAFILGIVFHRKPVIVYSVDQVLLPKEIFGA